MKRRKRRTYSPGYSPTNAAAWCALHDRGMNAKYMRAKHCISRNGACQHLRWEVPEEPYAASNDHERS